MLVKGQLPPSCIYRNESLSKDVINSERNWFYHRNNTIIMGNDIHDQS